MLSEKLIKEWHPTKNTNFHPNDILPYSKKNIWWKCLKEHEWIATPDHRSRGTGCPFCSNKRINLDNCLATTNSKLASEWHSIKNGSVTPFSIHAGSNKKAWWLCSKNSEHVWEAVIASRNRGVGCSICAGQKVSAATSLALLNPTLASEWHSTKNGILTPNDFMSGSSKKVWWQCEKGHEWYASICARNKGSGCWECSGYKVSIDNCLAVVNPLLAGEWHPIKNGSLTPNDILPNINKKVWWKCKNNHEWEASVINRNQGRNCPFCSGKRVNNENCLAFINPVLCKEWDSAKNHPITPYDVTSASGRKAWWICKKGHSWFAVIASRHSGKRGCPDCKKDCSFMELGIFSEMKFLFEDAIHKKRYHGVELDVFIPSLNVGVEYDGVYWHKNKEKTDLRKNAHCKEHGLNLIRIREKGLKKLNHDDMVLDKVCTHPTFELISNIITHVISKLKNDKIFFEKLNNYNLSGRLQNIKLYNELCERLPGPSIEKSLLTMNPVLASEWHPTKNGILTPNEAFSNSSKKIWWRCSKDYMHEWEAALYSRNKGSGCPYCSGRIASKDNTLEIINPELANEWHPTKNGLLTPCNTSPNSGKKVWWICRYNSSHEWQAKVANRNLLGNRCPICFGRKVDVENCLARLNPELLSEWHPTKNGLLTPYDVRPSSNKKIWWICMQNHEWQAYIYNRKQGQRCPLCWKINKR